MVAKKDSVTFWMDKELMATLRKLRQEKGIVISRFVELAITEKLQREGFVKAKEGKEVRANA
jgi:hypothetical protein